MGHDGTTSSVQGNVIHVHVAHQRDMPGIVWTNYKSKDQQIKFWNLAIQSKGEGKGAWTMDQVQGAMSEEVVYELKYQYRIKRLAGLLPSCCADMLCAEDLFDCTIAQLKIRCYALMGQDRDGKQLTNEESGDIGKLMMTKNWLVNWPRPISDGTIHPSARRYNPDAPHARRKSARWASNRILPDFCR